MKTVDILFGTDGVDHIFFTNLLGERELNENTVYVVIGVELINKFEEAAFRAVFGEVVGEGADSEFGTGLLFHPDVDLARRVVPDEYDREAWDDVSFRQGLDPSSDFRPDIGGNLCAANDFRHDAYAPREPWKGGIIAEGIDRFKDEFFWCVEGIAGVSMPC